MSSTAHILVVSHDQEDSLSLTRKLQQHGYDSSSHNEEDDVLQLVQARKPDLIIISGNDGANSNLNLTRALKGQRQAEKTPLILMIGQQNGPTQQVEGLRAGADACLPYPYHDAHLFGRIEALARLGVMQEEVRRRMQTSSKFGHLTPALDSSGLHVTGDANFLLVGPADADLEEIELALNENGALIHAHGPSMGKTYLERRQFDAILLNIPAGMEEDYLLFAQDVRRNSRLFNIPIICLMREKSALDPAAPYTAGAAEVFTHPLNVNDFRVRVEVLVSQQRQREAMIALFRQAHHVTLSDSLTGLYSYGYMMEHLQQLTAEANAHNRSLTLGMFTLNNLREINNQYGYSMGDKILRQVGQLIGNLVRGEDLPARYGGRRFALIMPDTRLTPGEYVARRIGSVINFTEIMSNDFANTIRAYTSTGVATLAPGMSVEDLVQAAIDNCR